MQPGDEATAYLAIVNGGLIDLTYTLAVDATTSSLLDSGQPDDLQLEVARCGATFTVCTQIVYVGRAITPALPVGGPPMGGPDTVGSTGQFGLRPLTQDYLRVRVSFPVAAGNAFQDAQTKLHFVWTSTQAL